MKQLDESTQNVLNNRYRTTATIVFGELFIALALIAAAWFLAGKFEPFGATTGAGGFAVENLTNPGGAQTTTTFLWITLLVLAIAVFLLRRVIFAAAILRDTATLRGAAGVLQSLQNKTILLTGVALIIAVIGFVIALMTGNPYDAMRGGGIALIVFVINFPRKSSWQRIAAAAGK